jgi:hypothetical protein
MTIPRPPVHSAGITVKGKLKEISKLTVYFAANLRAKILTFAGIAKLFGFPITVAPIWN